MPDKLLISILELKGSENEWVHIGVPGRFYDLRNNKFVTLTSEIFDKVISQFESDGLDVVLDYRHQSIIPGIKAPAAAWFDALENRDDGLWAKVKEWTPEGKKSVDDKEYKFISPVIAWNAPDRRTGKPGHLLHSVALTNTPNLIDLKPLAASAFDNFKQQFKQENRMNELIKLLCSVFGFDLADDADDAAVLEAVKSLKDRVPAEIAQKLGHKEDKALTVAEALPLVSAMETPTMPKEINLALGLAENATVADASACVLQMRTEATKTPDVNAITDQVAQRMKDEQLLQAAVKDGRVAPALQSAFEAQLKSKDPAVVTNSRLILEGLTPSGIAAPGLGTPGDRPDGGAGNQYVEALAGEFGIDPKKVQEKMKEISNG